MLSELDQLSQNISRLISISSRRIQAQRETESQLVLANSERDAARAALNEEREATRAALEAIGAERDALREERDALAAKIDDAQVRLNAILEKLPHGKNHRNQPDLLDAMPPHADKDTELIDAAHTENGEHA
jgi:uncharacterized coiled-coil DUF342 family protein